MALFSRAIPRRAAMGAFAGFLFSLYVLLTGALFTAAGWFLLAVSLLFARAFSYYVYLTWAILWVAWRGVLTFRGELPWWIGAIEVLAPLVSIGLLSSSGYVEAVTEDEGDAVSP
jgi:hypothetical protein